MAVRAAASIKKELGIDAETLVGDRGEFTVWTNGEQIMSKGFMLPSEKKIIAAVRKAVSAASA